MPFSAALRRRFVFWGAAMSTGARWVWGLLDGFLRTVAVLVLIAAVAAPSFLAHRPAWQSLAVAGVLLLATFGKGAYRVWRKADGEASTARDALETMSSHRELTLAIQGLIQSGLGPRNILRLQILVKLVIQGAPTRLYDWHLMIHIGDGIEAATEHLSGASQESAKPMNLRALDEMAGLTPIAGETTGLVYFVVPKMTNSVPLDLSQTVLSLTVKDQEGVEWSTECCLGSFSDDEIEYMPPRRTSARHGATPGDG